MPNKETFYITTPIYYPSDNLHIGHAYTTVAADTMARFKKQEGYDTFFLTGTASTARRSSARRRPRESRPRRTWTRFVRGIKELWKLMDVDYDDFIRTSDERHVKAVQKIFRRLYDQGDIYKGSYRAGTAPPARASHRDAAQGRLLPGLRPSCGKRPTRKPTSSVREISAVDDRTISSSTRTLSSPPAAAMKCLTIS